MLTKPKLKKRTSVIFGFIGILFAAGLLLMIFNINIDGSGAIASSATNNVITPGKLPVTTNTQRTAAAINIATAITVQPTPPPTNYGTPDYFGTTPNYANSQLPSVSSTGAVSSGIKKFVDTLPGLGPAGANNLGQYIPVAQADNKTYNGSDYYEIGLVQYTEKMSSSLKATTLRGYVQLSTKNVTGIKIALKYPNGIAITDSNGAQIYAVDNPHYLGPLIIAQKNVPVRVKFTNYLPTGTDGNLFLPVDTTIVGAGDGPIGCTLDPANGIHTESCNDPFTRRQYTLDK